jgi:hypothetical protein
MDRYLQIRVFARAAALEATSAKTALQILDDIILGRFRSDVVNGKTLISTSEAGGSVTFQISTSLSPAEITEIALEAASWISTLPDPDLATAYPRRIRRLRASFGNSTAC